MYIHIHKVLTRKCLFAHPFLRQEVEGVFATLAGILHLTDIEFQNDPDSDGVLIGNNRPVYLGTPDCRCNVLPLYRSIKA